MSVCPVTIHHSVYVTDSFLPSVDPPDIVTQPSDQLRISIGSKVSFSVVAEGTELMYRWRRDGADLSDGSTYLGTNTSALIVLNAGTEQIGEYTCAVSNDVGSDTSDAATLTFRKWTAAVISQSLGV